jgi:hypothetical protein
LIFRSLRLEQLEPKVAPLGSARLSSGLTFAGSFRSFHHYIALIKQN